MGSKKLRQRRKPQEVSASSNSGNSTNDNDDKLLDEAIVMNRAKRRRNLALLAAAAVVGVVVIGIVLAVLTPWKNDEESSSSSSTSSEAEDQVPAPVTVMGTYELLETVPHDSGAFTQGLLTVENSDGERQFWESTGQYGESDLRLVNISTGVVQMSYPLPNEYFAEGIAHFPIQTEDNETVDHSFGIVQLTWREQTAFEYTFVEGLSEPAIANWTFQTTNTQGWGITYDPVAKLFYVVDGSIYLHVWDAATRQEITKHPVTYARASDKQTHTVNYLNELEWDPVTQTVLANVLFQDIVLRIDPHTGFVTVIYDLSALYPSNERIPSADVLNGIALTYDLLVRGDGSGANQDDDDEDDQVWVTGKYWPAMYRIRLVDPK